MPLRLIKRFKSDKRASVTLEAALIFPIIILLFYFFYIFLLACIIQMSMKSVAYTAVNSIASQIHVVDKVGQQVKMKAGYQSKMQVNTTEVAEQDFTNQIITILPEPIYTIVNEGKQGNWWPATNLATTIIGKSMFESMLLQLPESKGFDKDRLTLVYLQLPDIVNYTDATVKVTLQYELPYTIPFLSKRFIIREQASQRAWLPDSRSSNFKISNDDDMFIQLVSIVPNPVQPGRKATITVKTKPHSTLAIDILYKSGKSVAKNLDIAVANGQGEVSWEWFVSGNTTPGLWQYHIKDVNSDTELTGVFEVKGKVK